MEERWKHSVGRYPSSEANLLGVYFNNIKAEDLSPSEPLSLESIGIVRGVMDRRSTRPDP